MFMPLDLILRPENFWFWIEDYSDAKEKIHQKSSFKLLFDEEEDMRWIVSMILYCEDSEAKPLLYFSALAGAAFGSIHCAAWNFEFPSHAEKIMWRTATLTLIGVCLSVFLGVPIQKWVKSLLFKAREGSATQRIYGFFYYYKYTTFIPTILYPTARLTLLVLAIISLRNLPDSAFQTVTWTKFIPHI